MPDKPKSIDEIMNEAWEQTMGEADTLPEESQHLDVVLESVSDTPPEGNAQDASSTTQQDTGTQETEPAGEQQATTEESTQPAGSAEAPQHWSEADRTMFGTLTQEAKDFLLRRHRDMEADYTRKTQENANAIKLGKAAIDVIDTEIQTSLQMAGVDQGQFLKNLVGYHKLSMQDPVAFVRAVTRSLRLDPAQVFPTGTPPAGDGQQQTPPAGTDPLSTRLAAIEGRITRDDQARQQEAVATAGRELSTFSTEKDPQGNLLRPHFEQVKQTMGRLMMADETLDLQQAYEVAVFRDPELRKTLPAQTNGAAPATVAVDMDKVRRGEEAARAVKANKRGNGNGAVTPPAAPKGKMSLHEAMNAAADEIGLK